MAFYFIEKNICSEIFQKLTGTSAHFLNAQENMIDIHGLEDGQRESILLTELGIYPMKKY